MLIQFSDVNGNRYVLDISHNELFFGSNLVGSNAASQTLTLKNVGWADISLREIALSGITFSIEGENPGVLRPSQKVEFEVRFSPTTGGPSTGSIYIDAGVAGTAYVRLYGAGFSTVDGDVDITGMRIIELASALETEELLNFENGTRVWVYNDPDLGLNGFYIKNGASGVGSFDGPLDAYAESMSNALADIDMIQDVVTGAANLNGTGLVLDRLGGSHKTINKLESEFQNIIDNQNIQNEIATASAAIATTKASLSQAAANDAAAEADRSEVAADFSAVIGLRVAVDETVTTQLLGATTPNVSNVGVETWSTGYLISEGARISEVEIRVSADMVADVLLVDAGSRKVLRSATHTFTNGVSALDDPFGLETSPKAAVIYINRVSGGFIRTVAAVGNRLLFVEAGTYAVGSTLPAPTIVIDYDIAVKVTTVNVNDAIGPRFARLGRSTINQAMANDFGSGVRSITPVHIPTAAGASTSGTRNSQRFVGRGVLRSVNLTVSAEASGLVEHWRVIDGLPRLMDRFGVNLSSGANTVTVTGDGWALRGESYIAYVQTRGPNVSYAVGGSYYELANSAFEIGDEAAIPTYVGTFSILIGLNIDAPYEAHPFEVSSNGPATIDRQNFAGTSTPRGWTVASPITVSNGLVMNGAGGWTTFAGASRYYSVHKRRLMARVKIDDVTSIFGISCLPQSTASGIGGGVAMVDGTAGALRIYNWNGTGAGTLATGTAFASALVAGRSYMLDIEIDGLTITAILTDTVTGTATTATGTFGADAVTARFHGKPGFLHISGNVTVEWSRFAINAPRACRALIYGDSNSEGVATGVTNPSWAYQLAVGGDVMVSARSGESSVDMTRRLHELSDLRPKLMICAHGTNDTVLATWRINVGAFVEAAQSVNAEPILVRPLPQPAKAALMTAIDADISAGYFGRLRSIDWLGACSNANDRLTWNAALQIGDNLHTNNAGQTAMLDQALRDVPELIV